jgi:hypothetical protein
MCIDIVLVCLCSLDSITLGILLGESYYNWHPYACGLLCLASGLPTLILNNILERMFTLVEVLPHTTLLAVVERETRFHPALKP